MAKPKPTDDEVKQEFDELFRTDDSHRIMLDRTMFRNILYYLGEQWFTWFNSSGSFGFRYSGLPKAEQLPPTPVNNLVRDNVRSMKALTLNKDYVAKVWPNSAQQIDKDAAELAEFVSQHLEIRHDYESADVKELVEIWRQLTGNGFWRTFPDMGSGVYLVGSEGTAIGKTGDVRTECMIPLNVAVPLKGQTLRDKACVGVKSLKEKEWVEDTFKIKLSGGEGTKQLFDYQKQLMTLVASASPWKGHNLNTGGIDKELDKLVAYYEIEYQPTKDYPKGRYCAKAGEDIVINTDKMPIPVGKDGEWEYTLTHVPYNYTPGAFWATGSVDDLISPQNIMNEIDQTLAVNRKTLGRPWVSTPIGLTLRRISERGSSILALEYDATRANGLEPKVNRGMPYPNQILDERTIHRQAAQDATGDPKNVLRGQAPYAGAPGIAIDMLREAAEQSHTPDVKRFFRAYGQVKRKELMVVQQVYTENRILKIMGPGNEVLVRKFKGADLRNNTDIRLELASGIATTNAGRADLVMQLLQYNFFGNPAIQPDLQREILKMLGLSSFEQSTNMHKIRAEYENSILTGDDEEALKTVSLPSQPVPMMDEVTGRPAVDPRTGKPIMIDIFPPTHDPIFRFDRHDLHIEVLDKLIFGREFRTLPYEKQTYIIGHRDMHVGMLAAEQAELAKAQAQAEAGAEEAKKESVEKPAGPGEYEVTPFTEE
jgi:hypothetical protein